MAMPVGSISGAVPPLVGITLRTNHLSTWSGAAVYHVLLMADATPGASVMFRIQDYRDAGIPCATGVRGVDKAHKHMKAYVVAFGAVASSWAVLLGEAEPWIPGRCRRQYALCGPAHIPGKVDCANYNYKWSKTVFKVSLLVVMSISGVLGLELIPLPAR